MWRDEPGEDEVWGIWCGGKRWMRARVWEDEGVRTRQGCDIVVIVGMSSSGQGAAAVVVLLLLSCGRTRQAGMWCLCHVIVVVLVLLFPTHQVKCGQATGRSLAD